MPGAWSSDKILALAPDPASAKAGSGLASPRKWVSLGKTDAAIWGECQGSGATPYQTEIDPAEPAFKCTCPSRKFPCKHALGLFLLAEGQPAAFQQKTAPPWVTQWLEKRAASAEKRSKAAEAPAAAPADPGAKAKRTAERTAKVAAGLAELGLWLRDVVRGGLAAAQQRPPGFWEEPAARMVDAQAPGVARMLREMSTVPASGEGWPSRLLDRIGRLHLLVESFQRLDTLPAATVADVRGLIGWTIREDELFSTEPAVRDTWRVVGQRVEEEDRLRAQRTWLLGAKTKRLAVVFHFAAGVQPLDTTLVVGAAVDAELVFFPGAHPLRAAVKQRAAVPTPLDAPSGAETVGAALDAFGRALAANPWIERYPMMFQSAVPVHAEGAWWARDADGAAALPVTPRFADGWRLLALGGGRPIAVFAEWDGEYLLPMSAAAEGRFVGL